MSDWFEEWFRSEFYLKLYGHRDREEARDCVDLVLQATGVTSPADVLDLASGAGRHAVELARRRLNVTAVDLSPTLLEYARQEAADEGVELRLIESDMRRISFVEEFDLAVQLFTSFGYFDDRADDRLVLERIAESLRPDGWYALDLINPTHLRETLVPHNARDVDGVRFEERRRLVEDRVEKEIVIESPGTSLEFEESVRLYRPEEIEEMLTGAGFTVAEWFGGYHGERFDPETSPRMLIISRRR